MGDVMDTIKERSGIRITSVNYDSILKDMNHVIDLINTSNDPEELLSLYIYIIGFKHELKYEKAFNNAFSRLSKVISSNGSKWDKINEQQLKYIDAGESAMYRQMDIPLLIKQQRQIDDFFKNSYYDIKDYTEFSDKEIYNLLHSFYISKGDTQSLLILELLLLKKNIIEIGKDGALGEAVFTNYSDNQYIKLQRNHNFLDAVSLVHEIAHIKYYFLALKDRNPIDINKFYYIKQFIEAYPKYQEQAFCNYLLSKNIYLEDVRHYLLQDLYSHGKRIEKFLDKNNLNTYRVVDGKIGADLLIQSGIDDDIIRKSGNQEFYSKNFTDLDRDSLISFDIDTIKKI